MNCQHCKEEIPSKMKAAIASNVCPYCSKSIISDDRLIQMDLIKKALDKVELVPSKAEHDRICQIIAEILTEKFDILPISIEEERSLPEVPEVKVIKEVRKEKEEEVEYSEDDIKSESAENIETVESVSSESLKRLKNMYKTVKPDPNLIKELEVAFKQGPKTSRGAKVRREGSIIYNRRELSPEEIAARQLQGSSEKGDAKVPTLAELKEIAEEQYNIGGISRADGSEIGDVQEEEIEDMSAYFAQSELPADLQEKIERLTGKQ